MRQRNVLRTSVAAIALLLVAAAAQAKSFAWKVTGKNGGVLYLIGSVHLLSNDFYPLQPALEAAYKDSDLLVEEVDMAELTDPASQITLLGKAMLPSATPLDKVISSETYQLLVKRATALGLPVEPFKLLKPWMAALTLVQTEWQQAGFDPQLGLDKHFYDQAKADGMATQGLETAEYQISRLDGMTMEQQEHLLAESLRELDDEKANMKKLVEAWRSGDAAAVEKIVLSDLKAEPVLYQRLLVERNHNWLPKIEALFARPKHALVVVGAAHLVGPDGLLAALRAKGYTVEQL
ncbi:MAG TPA: TraB/GumN family protein [Vicinamibacterales bacterium]|nr:TraB/GumN family protein [Vicinamibacterales bacterium]